MQGDIVASRARLLAAYACFEQLSNEDPQDLESQRQLDALSSRLAGRGIKALPSRVGDPHEESRIHGVAGPNTEDARRKGAAFAFAYDACLETKGEARNAVAALDFKGLHTILLRVTRDPQLASDLLNDAIATALEKIRRGELAQDARLDGYIYRVALNLLRNHRRKEAPARFDTSDALAELAVDDAQPVAEHDTDKWKNVVTELMANLGSRDREILARFYLEEEDRMTIQRALGLTHSQFNKVIFRARARFRELLESRGWGKNDFL
jgi:RNA polymerase sigma-70 factor (ECF subfamily)